jgi:hypothetical protein
MRAGRVALGTGEASVAHAEVIRLAGAVAAANARVVGIQAEALSVAGGARQLEGRNDGEHFGLGTHHVERQRERVVANRVAEPGGVATLDGGNRCSDLRVVLNGSTDARNVGEDAIIRRDTNVLEGSGHAKELRETRHVESVHTGLHRRAALLYDLVVEEGDVLQFVVTNLC